MKAGSDTLREARSGLSYDAHSYHTKVPPPAISKLIAQHAPNGGTVGDAFCGSGTTGVAAALAERAQGVAYDVVLGDLSPYAVSIARALNCPPAGDRFEREAENLLAQVRAHLAPYWRTRHTDGRKGEIVYTIWSEVLICPRCDEPFRYWDIAVDRERGGIRRELRCECGAQFKKSEAIRKVEQRFDRFLGRAVERPVREPVLIAYEVEGERHYKAPDTGDLDVLASMAEAEAPPSCPRTPMLHREGPWGDLYRAGYHHGITHVHHFYTWRNFITVGELWERSGTSELADHLRFLVSSYNLSHSTLMSRVVFKQGSPAPVLTGYQTGTLYISSLPVEKNPLLGIGRSKLGPVGRALQLTRNRRGEARVITASAGDWGELPEQLAYAFVDPPFGANIPYAEANFIAEAWLGEFTDQPLEATMSRSQGKSATDYRAALAEGFEAVSSRLQTGATMTVVFHSADAEPWHALCGALADAGLATVGTQLLDKRQGSFKQVRSDGAVQGDVLIHVQRRATGLRVAAPEPSLAEDSPSAWLALRMDAADTRPDRDVERELFSSYVAERLAGGQPVEIAAADFYRLVRDLGRDALTSSAT